MYTTEKKPGYEHYEFVTIDVGARKGIRALQGMNPKWELESIPVVPLNGWRARNLAEEIFGVRDAGYWTLGTAKLVRAESLRNLPDWDGKHTDYLKRFTGVVSVEVVAVDPSYGTYIHITQVEGNDVVGKYHDQILGEFDMRMENRRLARAQEEYTL